jgi:8-oxo-dGTP pyrophosphatase MutT (NUDIX family)
MSHEVKLNQAQTSILRELLFRPQAGYAELQKPTGLGSDHFNFHIKRLVELGLVAKTKDGQYKLSTAGKEYSNKLDTDTNTVERQPKIAVIIITERLNAAGETEYLFHQRLKNPWYAYWGFPTGKVKWGESLFETSARELLEETGLEGNHEWLGIYHERAYLDDSDQAVEDKIFNVIHCTNTTGVLVEDFEGGHNEWLTHTQILSLPKKYQSWETEFGFLKKSGVLVELTPVYQVEEF